ncbi:MAG: ATP-dependent DNA helicase RecG [Acidobacteria bacterium]|nr:ATP-dependent DNA helicase RecG [Acidobacteriota bacterium]
MNLELSTPIIDLHKYNGVHVSAWMSKKLASAVAGSAGKADATDATVEDLLNYFPSRYEDRSNLIQIDQLYDGLEASVELYVRVAGAFRVGKSRGPKQPPLYIFEITGGDKERVRKPVVVMWFLSGKTAPHAIEYYTERFTRGTRLIAHGKWEWDVRRNTYVLKVTKPEELEILPDDVNDLLGSAETVDSETLDSSKAAKGEESDLFEDTARPEFETVHTARHIPVYRKLGSFRTKRLREIIYSVLGLLGNKAIEDHLPASISKRNGLISRNDAIKAIHFPPETASISDYERFRSDAQKRLIFDEFFWLSFALQVIRGEREKDEKGSVIEIPASTKNRIANILPFKLTEAQRRVVKQIFADMASDAPMNRLIQGDVGSGKTVVAFIAMFVAAENGYQAAMMAPTEILAEQHARNAEKFFEGTGYKVALLTGSMRAAEKRKALQAVVSGDAQIVIGTHSIIQEAVEFDMLGLAVVDEQHRFGVLQRAALKQLGKNPDIIVMSATPIPRSLAMTVYGDLDVSVIDELPPGRTPIKTVVVGEDKRKGVYKGLEREMELGRQIYVVYPLIEESEKLDLKAATAMYDELRTHIFPKRRIGLLHGKMKPAEKDQIMSEFVSGELDILVSTTVIEVGVDVPNASVMVIEHAERFGLSQLHQLRGRVGRGSEQSYCVLLTGDKKTATAKERLGIMEETNDGFRIAEKDLELRGEGEILGTRQSGVHIFKIANIIRDVEILQKAADEAKLLLYGKTRNKETKNLIERVRSDARYRLAGIG